MPWPDYCLAQSPPIDGTTYRCTRVDGHEGNHANHDALKSWPQQLEPLPDIPEPGYSE